MSANKTDALRRLMIALTVVFTLSPTIIFLLFSNVEGLSSRQRIESRTHALTTTATLFLGLTVMINAYYAAKRASAMQKSATAAEKNNEIEIKNTHLARERLVAERFMTAITQLGHENVATRTGAIYALERVAHDSPKEYWTIMEILTAFVRENTVARLGAQEIEEEAECHEPVDEIEALRLRSIEPYAVSSARIRTDIQAALSVIGRRNAEKDPKNQKLDLRYTDMRKADLQGANLQGANLRGADLSWSDLRGADLSLADLDCAKLCGSILYETNLQQANLNSANLSGANLNRTLLCGASMRAANLSRASLRAANLSDTNLYKANLYSANLKGANLSGAKLFLANLQATKLGKANLHGTGLIGANLQQANLNAANMHQANLNAANLQQIEIIFANLSEASLREADLSGANLMGANLQKAILYEADLRGANLMAANLSGANLCNAKLEGAILTGAKNLEPHQITMAVSDA
ncbi:MAG: pentapeptide repeat-containing protein [Rhizonema sp. NSF051]|nr:pentapeptide repeat-containing protein [Rhizonema sp. NSF051]